MTFQVSGLEFASCNGNRTPVGKWRVSKEEIESQGYFRRSLELLAKRTANEVKEVRGE